MIVRPDQRPPGEDTEFLPARMINEFVFCPRLFYLEHVDGLFRHNEYTLDGVARHRRVDKKPDPLVEGNQVAEQETIHARSVTLSSATHGIVAKLDLVEAEGNLATPVDYKRGAPRELADGTLTAWDPDRVQLAAQALVLRDNGYRCDRGVLFYWQTRQRIEVAIDAALEAQVLEAIEGAKKTMAAGVCPPPLVDSPKCAGCSLVTICMPDETTRCRQGNSDVVDPAVAQPTLFDIGPVFQLSTREEPIAPEPIRRLFSARDERKPLYLTTHGLHVGLSQRTLKIKQKGKEIDTIRLKDINQVNLFGNIQITTQALHALLGEDISVAFFSFGGWLHGVAMPLSLKNITWRQAQFRMADRPAFCLALAKELVYGKIRNQRTLLMRNALDPPRDVLRFLKRMAEEARRAESLDELLGIEGTAARAYFQSFSSMIKLFVDDDPFARPSHDQPDAAAASANDSADEGRFFTFDFAHRNRRPPRDPVNALLSLGYSLLTKDLGGTLFSIGLDPFLGFFHQLRHGRMSLALDLMEPFRPLIVDSMVLSAINQRMVTPRDFVAAGGGVNLTESGRKAVFRAYEQRMDQLVTHPLFGYKVSYRRLLEIQCRLLARLLLGEIATYPVFMTR
ncbi:MAG: CRISPR-associated exonuclease Cas4/endonuclease Cas1 fusion [Pirellulaceae bacterium]|nr:MAG: CRISPR-associated exonuclease Cas4/endonuclease Cas1 fusion [Pirellulaceae bacterium]